VDDLWGAFRARFLLDFMDIVAAQKAQNELQTLTMNPKKGGIDGYIVKFEELTEEVGFNLGNPSILYYFWKGLPPYLLSKCLESNPPPANWSDWKDTA
jgi:hypothetical protein